MVRFEVRGGPRILRDGASNTGGYSMPHRIVVSPEERDELEMRRLVDAFVKSVFEDNDILPSSSVRFGSPGEIRTPVDGSLPDRSPKPIIGRVIVDPC